MRRMERPDVAPYDALLLVSFGGPDRPEDVVPFLQNVTRGRGIPRERLEAVGEHYFLFGGKSPINELNRTLLADIRADLGAHGIDLPVYWGNRNWEPFLADTVAQMKADGVTRVACFATSAYSSYSSCRQYRENLAAASLDEGPVLDKIRLYFNHPGFLEPVVDAVSAATASKPDARLVFVTHSIPDTMNAGSGPMGGAYLAQHLDAASYVAGRVAEETGHTHAHDLVFCSRSGPPQVPWLEPDVNDHLEKLAVEGVESVVLIPIGFVSDHMEVVYDLDTEAMETAARLGLDAARVATSGTDQRFVAMVRDLLVERAAVERGAVERESVERGESAERAAVGGWPACWDRCAADCCPNPREPLPALSQLPEGQRPAGDYPAGVTG
ncbi:MAG: protoporphyrin/coproporphyrin ferrochelatase [Nocardioidaceae bacterium]|nr:protoporphyrin/coproporphyrin ferrochelatase [Nocardioidaceae bacterium]